jgi:hypothetical protein
MKVTVEDRYSVSANPRRGYHDYVCSVVIDGEGARLPEEDMLGIVEFFHRRTREKMSWMWCSPPKRMEPSESATIHIWTWKYGYDSGD